MILANLRADPAPRKKTGGIAWREAGKGPPLLLIHGVGLNADAWESQIVALSPRRRLFAVDLPGHGESDRLPDGAELTDYVTAMAQFIDALGVSPVAIVGHSLGALIALGLALDHPEKIAALVTLNAVYCRDPVARSAVEVRAAQLSGGVVDHNGPVARWFPDDPNGPLARRAADWLDAVDPKGYANAYHVFATSDHAHEGRLGGLDCPALFITGVSDPNSTPAMSARMARETPHGNTVALPGARHMMHLTHPAETTNTIWAFLNKAEVKARAELAVHEAEVAAARAEEERLAEVAEEERQAKSEEAARVAEAARAEEERLAEAARAEEERLAQVAEEERRAQAEQAKLDAGVAAILELIREDKWGLARIILGGLYGGDLTAAYDEIEAAALSMVTPLPASDLTGNQSGYAFLSYLRPDNAEYRKKAEYFVARIKDAGAKADGP
jgi:pimeloyl-ACP methyl ester carboxylesterase